MHLSQCFPKMRLFQPDAGDLDEDSFEACVDHFRQQLGLITLPEVA